jgi:non-ribosomal peptide synthetase-like protein
MDDDRFATGLAPDSAGLDPAGPSLRFAEPIEATQPFPAAEATVGAPLAPWDVPSRRRFEPFAPAARPVEWRSVPADQPESSVLDGTDACPARTLVDIFSVSVARWPLRVALDDGRRRLTFRQLDAEARTLADRLRAWGIGRGDRIGVRVPSGTTDLYVAVLGTLYAGAAYVPVDFSDPAERAEQIWRDVDACAVVTRGLDITPRRRGSGRQGPATGTDDCWLIFTSGSTGTPKAVAVHHRAAAAFVDAETTLWHVRDDDRVLAGLSVGFDASCEEMWLAWRNGAALVPAPRELVQAGVDLGPWLAARQITVVSTVPTLAAMWDERDLAGVRLLIFGGECCPERLGWRLSAGREVWNTYGPTEATVVTTATRLFASRPVTIGRPLPGWSVAVVDEHGEPTVCGEPGELVIGGVGLARYLDPELDRARYAGVPALGWERAYRTGDMARVTADGLEYLGRRDDQVKIGGRRIELGEIDAQLCDVPGVKAGATALRHTPAGSDLLVGYVVGDVDASEVRARLAERLPAGIVPRIVLLDAMPLKSSGKVDREALPWPPPATGLARGAREVGTTDLGALTGTAAWVAEKWAEQLGPLPMTADSDFFELGGTSLTAARLVSDLRVRFPSTAVADIYNHRRLGALASRLDELSELTPKASAAPAKRRRWDAVQLAGVLVLVAIASLQWTLGALAYSQWYGGTAGPRIGWPLVIVGWLLVSSAPTRAAFVVVLRSLLLGRLRPGRYPRHGWLACRIWFVERLAAVLGVNQLAGTPWAVRYARMFGAQVGDGARLESLPLPTGLVRIGARATIEGDVDLQGWWMEDRELVVGEIVVGAGARVGTRSVLMPGADVGAGAEIEPGSVVSSVVPPGERWSGSPARPVGVAAEGWPVQPPPPTRHRRAWKAMYGLGLGVLSLVPLGAAVPEFFIFRSFGGQFGTSPAAMASVAVEAPALAACFVVSYALIVAFVYRAASWLVRPGWHDDGGATAWALWFTEAIKTRTQRILFPLYSSVYTRSWLRLLGIPVGRRTEISTSVGMNRLVRIADTSFAADDVVYAGKRRRQGWLEVTPIEVGSRTFLGNGAILRTATRLGDDSLVGVLSSPPRSSADGTSWLGLPALELPRVREPTDPARTTNPPRRLVVARGAMEALRILLPGSVSIVLGGFVLFASLSIGAHAGGWVMLGAAPAVLLAASVAAVLTAIAVKWLLMGRYRPGVHPFWSFFVWRDEIANTCQEQLAGAWLMLDALGSPLMPPYLRAMGASVGRGVWFETLAITEYDVVRLGDGCAVNRGACVETHLFHDRMMKIGPALLDRDSTLGPHSAVLPDTVLGPGCSVGARSVVLRGERLPANTRWQGVPVEAL